MKLHDESPGPSIFADLRSTTIALLSIVRGLDNKAAYDSRDAIAIMSASEELQLPELSIVERLDGWLDGKAMIDIGVGGGRTTHHFAPRVGRYLGIDYSTEIIKACELRFRSSYDNVQFLTADFVNPGTFEGNPSILCSLATIGSTLLSTPTGFVP